MNHVERLQADLAGRFPGHVIEIDPPADLRGTWHLDVKRGNGLPPVVVEWRPDRGFGVSTPGEDDYGAGPDEVYPNGRATFDRVVELVLSGGRTEPPQAVRLAELRQIRGLSQPELAERAGVGQANISQIEHRLDIKVSTLRNVVAALGGTMSIVVRFPDGLERELDIWSAVQAAGPAGGEFTEGTDQTRRRRRQVPKLVKPASDGGRKKKTTGKGSSLARRRS